MQEIQFQISLLNIASLGSAVEQTEELEMLLDQQAIAEKL